MAQISPINNTVSDSWSLENDVSTNQQRPKFLPERRGDRDHITIRVPKEFIRFIDVYVQTATDPYLKTRSDAINDAVLFWVWDKRNFENIQAKIALADIRRATIESIILNMERVLKDYEDLVDICIRNRNWKALEEVGSYLTGIRQTVVGTGGETTNRDYERLCQRVKDVLPT